MELMEMAADWPGTLAGWVLGAGGAVKSKMQALLSKGLQCSGGARK